MKLEFVVNSISAQPRNRVGTFDGITLGAAVPGVEVELYDPKGIHGSLTLFFSTPDEQAWAWSNAKPGEPFSIELGETAPAE